MKSMIYGSGANSVVTLYRIHQGDCYFKKDTSTEHSQVKLLQTQLNSMGHDCGTPDGKYGDNTVSGVKKFQKAKELTADGLFGKASLEALEAAMGDAHLDEDCIDYSDLGAYGCYDDTDSSLAASKYKVSSAMRVKSYTHALECIYSFEQQGTPLTVAEFLQNLDDIASNLDTSYDDKDCANYVYEARNEQGAQGATSELAYYVEFFGSIKDLGGYDRLIPGMQLFQGFRKTATSNRFYASHIGVYAGEQMVNGTLIPAVYQSSDSYPTLAKKYPKTSGPNLTSLSDHWNYWGWSRFIKVR
ncbi:MAG: peptidoglycan-binding protein [Clostridia bacterium]|nr:peptidoglycan-binding protein [Clostridia bacterium]